MLSSFSPFKYKHHILFTFRKTLISLSICERASAKGICTFVTVLHICLKTLQQFHIPKSRPHLKSKATFYCLLLSKSTFNQEIWQLFPDSNYHLSCIRFHNPTHQFYFVTFQIHLNDMSFCHKNKSHPDLKRQVWLCIYFAKVNTYKPMSSPKKDKNT